MPAIATLIVNWNNSQLTVDTIESLLKTHRPTIKLKIFILDNGSTDNSWNLLSEKFKNHPAVILFKSENNLGFTGGNNFLIKNALSLKSKLILLANNDLTFDKNFFNHLLKLLKTPKIALVAPKIYFAPGYEFHPIPAKQQGKIIWALGGRFDWHNIYGSNNAVDDYDHGQYQQDLINPDFLSGCCLLVKSAVFKKIGLFDNRYYMYLEDVDFCHRAKLAGYSLAVAAKSMVWHFNSASSSVGSNLHDYFIHRNRLLLAFKFATTRTKLAIFRQSLSLLLSGRPWQRQGIKDFFFHRFGQGTFYTQHAYH